MKNIKFSLLLCFLLACGNSNNPCLIAPNPKIERAEVIKEVYVSRFEKQTISGTLFLIPSTVYIKDGVQHIKKAYILIDHKDVRGIVVYFESQELRKEFIGAKSGTLVKILLTEEIRIGVYQGEIK